MIAIPSAPDKGGMWQRRISLCNACEKYRKTKQCGVCGCFMPLKAKFKRAACPLGKWDKEA